MFGNQLKFEISNNILSIDYQFYFLILADLSIVKEVFINYAYLIISILKLRPSKAFNLAIYSYTKSYTVLLSKNLTFLLTLFPSSTLAQYNIIYIV